MDALRGDVSRQHAALPDVDVVVVKVIVAAAPLSPDDIATWPAIGIR